MHICFVYLKDVEKNTCKYLKFMFGTVPTKINKTKNTDPYLVPIANPSHLDSLGYEILKLKNMASC